MFIMGSCYAYFCVPVVTIRRRTNHMPQPQNYPNAILPIENEQHANDRADREEKREHIILEPGA